MPTATQVILENALNQFAQMCKGEDQPLGYSAEDIKDFYERLVEDFCDAYDEEWFALVATPAIKAQIDWAKIAEAVSAQEAEMVAEDTANHPAPPSPHLAQPPPPLAS